MSGYSFPAQYAGRCALCGDVFEVGGEIFYNESDEIVGALCCGDPDGGDTVRGTEALTAPLDRVMPRGRTTRDRCGRCFQIPASNGVCGCS